MKDIYLDQDRYDALVKVHVVATSCDEPFSGYNENMIQIALGEACGIWPESIRDDAVRARRYGIGSAIDPIKSTGQ